MTRRRPLRPTSYVTRILGRDAWREILARYRAGPPTLGATKPVKPRNVAQAVVSRID